MNQLGHELKKAREASGLSLSEVATKTKISVTALEALERDDFSRLPGGIFGRSFVRAYAIEVGADPDAIVARFVEQLEVSEAEEAARRAARMPEITDDDRQFLQRQKRALLFLQIGVAVLLLAVAALVIWRARIFWSAPAAVAEPAPVAAPMLLPPPADLVPGPVGETAASPAPTPPPAAAPLVVELDASADSWVSVTVDDAAPVSRLFRAGDHQRLEVTREILLDVGNAGGVRLVLDGRTAKPLGRDGARARTRITRQNASGFLE